MDEEGCMTIKIQEMIRSLLAIGFTEEAIACGAKVNKSTISRILTGKTRAPRYILANSIEEIFLQYGNNSLRKN